jgi:CheY-like chemotaxis protein
MPTRILIAEDRPRSGLRFEVCLESEGSWEIIDVENGQDAVAKAQAMNLTSSFST